MQKKSVFFPNLNGVRLIAALMVVIHHVEQVRHLAGYPSSYRENSYGVTLGGLGVTLFFVLSGYLITYLLLKEQEEYGTISLKNFYVRRILRIWPLYYLIVLLAFFLIPNYFDVLMVSNSKEILQDNFYGRFFMFLFFLPNVAYVTSLPVLFAAQAWSIGVEEQFYAIWPVILKFFRKPQIVMIVIILLFLALNFYLERNASTIANGKGVILKYFFTTTRIDCMAVGGLFAWAAWRRLALQAFLRTKIAQLLAYGLVAYFLCNDFLFKGFGHLPYAILFGIIIDNLAMNENTILRMENRLFDYGGKISYGIYMYQPIAIIATFVAYDRCFTRTNDLNNYTILYLGSVLLTLLFAACSYHLYEKRFLNLKVRYSNVLSGDHARGLSPEALRRRNSPF